MVIPGFRIVIALAVLTMIANSAAAQVPRFFSADANLFDPEIGIVQSGAVMDAQAVVSPDRKYVTLNMGASQATPVALREFSTERGELPSGFAGESVWVAAGSSATTPRPPAPSAVAGAPTVLQRAGVIVLARVRPGDVPTQFSRPAVR